jgi:hypothetical protein
MDTDDVAAFLVLVLFLLGIGYGCTHQGGEGPREPAPCDVRPTC